MSAAARELRDGAAPASASEHPDLVWAASGAMALTGNADGPPLLAPAPIASRARDVVRRLAALAKSPVLCSVDGAALLGEHAAARGLRRGGTISPGGRCRLLRSSDRWIAVSLPRPDDLALLPAWLGDGDTADPWTLVATRVAGRPADELVARARLLGLAAAVAATPEAQPSRAFRVSVAGAPRGRRLRAAPLVIDLSSLWAGPLCGHLLGLAGARVIKIESVRRPDGARFGPPAFFDLLHAGHESVALDFASGAGRAALARLVAEADIVIEASRPRALSQLGIDADAHVAEGRTWVSITGYGRSEPGSNWVAFGDDAGVAAGLAVATGSPDAPVFCADAIADPLAGIHAAFGAYEAWQDGGGRLLDVSLRDVAAHVAGLAMPRERGRVIERGRGWAVVTGDEEAAVLPPRLRTPAGRARALGADTRAVLGELANPA